MSDSKQPPLEPLPVVSRKPPLGKRPDQGQPDWIMFFQVLSFLSAVVCLVLVVWGFIAPSVDIWIRAAAAGATFGLSTFIADRWGWNQEAYDAAYRDRLAQIKVQRDLDNPGGMPEIQDVN